MANKLCISNFKISVKAIVNVPALNTFKADTVNNCKDKGSFFVFREEPFVFCIYYRGHINITGIRSSENITVSLRKLMAVKGVLKVYSVKVDNITCTSKLSSRAYQWTTSFTSYLTKLDNLQIFDSVQYSPQVFPGAFLKRANYGTVVFFATGKFNIVGCKSKDELLLTIEQFISAINNVRIL